MSENRHTSQTEDNNFVVAPAALLTTLYEGGDNQDLWPTIREQPR